MELTEEAKDSKKKGFCKYTTGKKKTEKNVHSVLSGAGSLMTKNMEKAQVLRDFFTQF